MKEKITNALLLMEAAGMKSYGKQIDAVMIEAWCRVMKYRIVNVAFIEPACDWFMAHGKEIPTPSEFADRANKLEDDARPPFRVTLPELPQRVDSGRSVEEAKAIVHGVLEG